MKQPVHSNRRGFLLYQLTISIRQCFLGLILFFLHADMQGQITVDNITRQCFNNKYDLTFTVSGAPPFYVGPPPLSIVLYFTGYKVTAPQPYGIIKEDCYNAFYYDPGASCNFSTYVCACNGVTYSGPDCAENAGYPDYSFGECTGGELVQFTIKNIPSGSGVPVVIEALYAFGGVGGDPIYTENYTFPPYTCSCPPLTVTATSNSPRCTGATLQLQASASNITAWQWSGPGGFTSTQQNPVRSNATATYSGIYTVTATNSQGCTGTATTQATVLNPVQISNAVSNNLSGSFQVSGGLPQNNGSNYASVTMALQGNPGVTATLTPAPFVHNETVSFIVPQAGTYTIMATDANGCSKTSAVVVSGTCITPATPTLTKAGHTFLDLNWIDSLPGSNYAYEIRWRIPPNGAWSSDTLAPFMPVFYCGGPQNIIDPPSATRLNNLLPCTSYDIQVRKICAYNEADESTTTWSGSATYSTKECGNAYFTAGCHPVAQVPDWITISNFSFGPLQDTSGYCGLCEGCDKTGDGYLYQSLLSFRIDPGQTYTANYTIETGSQITSGYLNIWVDLNLDLDFDDAGELLLNKPVSAGGPQSWPVTIPANASVGGSRMRLLLSPASNSGPCAVFGTGAVRDYPVLLGLDCTGPPTANLTYTYNGLDYTFTNTSSGGSTYHWDFGDGTTSTALNPVHTYTAAGFYTLVLTVGNPCGTSTKTVLIHTVPTADFSADPFSGCATLTVAFTNASSSNATAFFWQFPGGQPVFSNLVHPIIQYQNAGTYTVALSALNGSGTTTETKTGYIVVQIIPTVNFTKSVNGLEATFNNSSSGASSYLWNFGDGFTSIQANPIHTYQTGGTYTVMLTATNDCGSATTTQTVSLTAPPTANFSAMPTTGCAPLMVQYISTSVGNPTMYAWSFPGGNPSNSTAQNPVVVYNAPGTYSSTLIVGNAGGSDTTASANYITANPGPTAGFTSSVAGATATFTNSSVYGATYSWNFGNGQTSTLQNPSHTYTSDGTYTVILTATNACGTSTASQVVVIVTPPTANFSATPATGCAPLTVQFTSTSSANSITYAWAFPGGTPSSSTAQNPVVAYNTPGVYTVSLTVGNNAGSNTATKTNFITVNPGPTAGFTNFVIGATAAFTNTSVNGVNYSWAFGDGQTSTAQNPSHTYASDGTYTVTLTATNACGTSTANQVVVIVTPPTANFSATPATGCGPLTVQFTSTSSANSITYTWAFPGGAPSSSTAQNPTVVYNTPGIYTVSLTVGNNAGSNTATKTNFITVNPGPTAGFTNSIIGATATFTNTTVNGVTYSWAFGDGETSTAQNPSHTYTIDGTYTVTLTATNACGTSTASQVVVIVTPPTANFSATPATGCGPLTVQFNNTSSVNTTSFLWQFPGGMPASSTLQNPVVQYSAPGTYSVMLIAINPIGRDTLSIPQLITAFPAPIVGFNNAINGTTVSFTNTSSNANAYSWSFGDGFTSTQANPSHSYSALGTYTVCLTATGNCGSEEICKTIVIDSTLIQCADPNWFNFISNDCGDLHLSGDIGITFYCEGQIVKIENNSSPAAAIQTTFLDWGDGTCEVFAGSPVLLTHIYDIPDTCLSTSNGSVIFPIRMGHWWPCANGLFSFNYLTTFVTVQVDPVAKFSVQSGSACPGQPVQLTNQSCINDANATYFWDFGDGQSSVLENPGTHVYGTPGTYVVELQVTNSCDTKSYTQSVTIGTPPNAVAAVEANTCPGQSTGSATVTANGGIMPYQFLWNNGQTNGTAVNLLAGAYTVTVTDAAGCMATATATVNAIPGPVPSTIATSSECSLATGVIDLSIQGGTPGYSFLWSNGGTSEDLSNLPAGAYTVTVTDAAGCTATASATVANLDGPNASAFPLPTTCGLSNGHIDLDVQGGTPSYSYLWSNGATAEDIQDLEAGTYTVTVSDAAGCTAVATAEVDSSSPLEAQDITETCLPSNNEYAVTFMLKGGAPPYVLLSGSGDISADQFMSQPIPAGTPYTFFFTDAAGCGPLEISGTKECVCTDTVEIDTVICKGEVFVFNNRQYDQPGMYADFFDAPSGCDTLLILALEIQQPEVSINGDDFLCQGEFSLLTLQSNNCTGCTYQWSDPALSGIWGEVNPSMTTIYSVTATDQRGCTASDSITVRVQEPVTVPLDFVICPGGSVTVCDQVFSQAGTYTVACPCDSTVILSLDVITGLYAVAYPDTFNLRANQDEAIFAVAFNDSLTANSAWVVEILTDGQHGRANPEPDARVHYRLTDTDFHGIDSFTYEICHASCPEPCDTALAVVIIQNKIPNAFSPDNDGYNDTFDPFGWHLENDQPMPVPTSAALTIWNRWNEVVFHADPYPEKGWDGRTSTGKRAPQGTYYYTLHMTGGETELIRGVVQVLVSGK